MRLHQETASAAAGETAINWLCATLPEGTPLLLVDLQKASGGKAALQQCTKAGLSALISVAVTLRVGKPPPRLDTSFFAREDGLWARQQVHAAMHLIVSGTMPVAFPTAAIQFTPDQRQVIDNFDQFLNSARSSPVSILRGAAGTGKSTLLRELVHLAIEVGRSPRLVAPTGQASRRLRDATSHTTSTIHSALYLYNNTLLDENGGRSITFNLQKPYLGNLLIVDEASLIGDTSLNTEDDAVQLIFNEGRLLSDLLNVQEVYGPELQILFVGDQHQLPPVAEGNNRPALDSEILAQRVNSPVPI